MSTKKTCPDCGTELPPEQAAGRLDQVKESADVYSLGSILYATLTGRPPFQADNPLDTLMQVLEREPPSPRALNPKVPLDLETICLKCLEKDRRRRYPSARAVVEELQRFLNGEPIQARPISRPARTWRWCKRNPVLAVSGSAVLLATIITIVVLAASVAWVTDSRDRAIRLANEKDELEKQALMSQRTILGPSCGEFGLRPKMLCCLDWQLRINVLLCPNFPRRTMLVMESRERSSDSQPESAGQFVSTHWSLVLRAGERANVDSNRALEKLCRAYWPPLYAYVRRRVSDVHEAQDLTQAFFERLLEKHYLADADPERGRFRAFLITAFKHFLSKEWDKAKTQKRGGGRAPLPLDFASQDSSRSEPADQLTAERAYERQWAVTLLNRVMNRLQRDMERNGKGQQFHYLKGFIGGPGDSSYATPATELGLSESAARMAASRMRGRYRELLRDEIAQTVSSEEEIESEIQHLFTTFSDR